MRLGMTLSLWQGLRGVGQHRRADYAGDSDEGLYRLRPARRTNARGLLLLLLSLLLLLLLLLL